MLSKSPVYVKNLEDGASTLDIHPVPNQEADPDIPLRYTPPPWMGVV